LLKEKEDSLKKKGGLIFQFNSLVLNDKVICECLLSIWL